MTDPLNDLPRWLQPTWDMLKKAFPSGISNEDYWAIIKLLSEHASQRNIADVMSKLADRDRGIVYNDVLSVCGGYTKIPAREEARVSMLLRAAGFDEWIASDGMRITKDRVD
jgi:hypothetical protein